MASGRRERGNRRFAPHINVSATDNCTTPALACVYRLARERTRRFSVLAVLLFDRGGFQFDEQTRHRQSRDSKQC